MVQQPGSRQQTFRRAAVRGKEVPEARAACAFGCGAVAVLCGAMACATGVDVSDSEFEEICATPGVICGDVPAGFSGSSGSGPVGSSGSAGSPPIGNSGSGGAINPTPSGGSGGASGSSGTSGSSGASGSISNPPLQPLAMGSCMQAADDDVVIVYTDRGMGSAMANQATMVLHVNNVGPAFDLTALTIRYWFTDDGLSNFIGDIDYASQGGGQNLTSAVTVTFGEEFGSDYAAIGFSSGGSVGPEGVDTIQVRLHTTNYQMMNQSNDFSFLGTASNVDNRNITPYVNGVQVGGCVPLPP